MFRPNEMKLPVCSRISALLLLVVLMPVPQALAEKDYTAARKAMVSEIEADVGLTSSYIGADELDPRVMMAMETVPRHELVPKDMRPYAYENRPLPIGHGQTISQPYIVALMTHLLQPMPEHKVLEVGTGSGYQAAILAGLVARVYTIEIIEALGSRAGRDLARLGYDNVDVRIGDGYYGWESAAPFDSIVVAAVAGHVPPPLLRQLKPGGRMIIPVGSSFMTQHLVLVEKDVDGGVTARQILPVRFVPLTGGHD
jgi:protein-L-isoaspartate(D-aspartate) O-methyltransferase